MTVVLRLAEPRRWPAAAAIEPVIRCSLMTKAARLLQDALELPPEARGRLAASLIDSLDGRVDPDAEASWDAEVDRRLDVLDAGQAQTVPWSRVEQGLLKRRRGSRRR